MSFDFREDRLRPGELFSRIRIRLRASGTERLILIFLIFDFSAQRLPPATSQFATHFCLCHPPNHAGSGRNPEAFSAGMAWSAETLFHYET